MTEMLTARKRGFWAPFIPAILMALNLYGESSDKAPVDYANPLVGTAPLDKQELIGNAPPPGKELFTGFTLPGPALPHGPVNLSPINKDITAVIYPGLQSASKWN
jgi:hypothetical protein